MPIAQFKRPEGLVYLFPQTFHSVIREELVSTQPFVFNGHKYDFRAIAPGGLTLTDVGSTTALSGIPGLRLSSLMRVRRLPSVAIIKAPRRPARGKTAAPRPIYGRAPRSRSGASGR